MNRKPLVSVIMSEYNSDISLLKSSIESIINQDYNNLELIVIDDCGKNDVEEVVSQYKDERIKVYKNEFNLGLVQSLNKAIELCNGKYIARMDTDDYSYSNRIRLQVEFLEKNPRYALIGSRVDKYDGKEIWGETNFWGEVTRQNLLEGSSLTHPSVMYRADVIRKIGGYINYKRCEDYATWIEFYYNGYEIYVMKEKLVRYHLSLEDYKKRTLKTRKDLFRMLHTQYKKLNPTLFQMFIVYTKNIIAGILPWKIIYNYHRRKNKVYEKN